MVPLVHQWLSWAPHPSYTGGEYSRIKRTITLHVLGLMVCYGQQNTLVWEKSSSWVWNASGPLDAPSMGKNNQFLVPFSTFILLIHPFNANIFWFWIWVTFFLRIAMGHLWWNYNAWKQLSVISGKNQSVGYQLHNGTMKSVLMGKIKTKDYCN